MMRRQMARRVGRPGPRFPLVAIAAVIGVLLVCLIAAMVILGAQKPSPTPAPSGSLPAVGSGGSSAKPTFTATPTAGHPASPAASASGSPSTSPLASGTPSPAGSPGSSPSATPAPTSSSASPTPSVSSAPQSAADFDLENQVIPIAFPLRADTVYHYRDNWLGRRTGPPDPYNHAGTNSDGELVRLHDGIDIYAPENEPVVAPFDGTIIDPETKWTPWEPDRYGLTVVVESDEPQTTGYTAVLVHLDRVWVDIGQHVTRGQVIGVLGRTGNAEDVRPQLHFELRAPFLIDWTPIGEPRKVDAFNPYPSLTAADPNT
jgi:murein DD-endopeptidase MepM/ murein hydrolase activator NlpD